MTLTLTLEGLHLIIYILLQKYIYPWITCGRMVIGVRGRLFFEYIVVFQINCGVSLAEGLEGVAHGLGVGVAELAA